MVMNSGWLCERCQSINAPWKAKCDCAGLASIVQGTTIGSSWIHSFPSTVVRSPSGSGTRIHSFTVGGPTFRYANAPLDLGVFSDELIVTRDDCVECGHPIDNDEHRRHRCKPWDDLTPFRARGGPR